MFIVCLVMQVVSCLIHVVYFSCTSDFLKCINRGPMVHGS